MSEQPTRTGPFWDAAEARTVTVRFEARPEFTNPQGNVQGGMLAAMLDDTMGPALVASLPPGKFVPTLEMKVSYLAPARVGPLWGHGRVVHAGGSTAFVEGDLVDGDGRLVARGSATVRIVDLQAG